MSNNDIVHAVNAFMLANAPTLTAATPMTYDLLKVLAGQLLFTVKTTREHAEYVLGKKYGHLYDSACLSRIIRGAVDDQLNLASRILEEKREKKRFSRTQPSQPVLLTA